MFHHRSTRVATQAPFPKMIAAAFSAAFDAMDLVTWLYVLSVTFVELCPRLFSNDLWMFAGYARGWPTCGASHGGATGGVVPTDVAGCRWLAFGRTPERTALGGNHGHRADRTRGCRHFGKFTSTHVVYASGPGELPVS